MSVGETSIFRFRCRVYKHRHPNAIEFSLKTFISVSGQAMYRMSYSIVDMVKESYV